MTVVKKIQQNIIKYVRLVHNIWTLCLSMPISILVGEKQYVKRAICPSSFRKQKPESTRKTNYFCWDSEVHIWWIIYYPMKPRKRFSKSNATDTSNNIVDVVRLNFYSSLPILIHYIQLKFQTKYYYTVFNLEYDLLWNTKHFFTQNCF